MANIAKLKQLLRQQNAAHQGVDGQFVKLEQPLRTNHNAAGQALVANQNASESGVGDWVKTGRAS